MIKFSLLCENSHGFESWFSNGAAYEQQAGLGRVECPVCGSNNVTKAIMAPAIATSRAEFARREIIEGEVIPPRPVLPVPAAPDLLDAQQQEIRAMIGAMRTEILANTIDVGKSFPEEARKMHAGESPERPIRGEASIEEVHALIEDGVNIMPIPAAPEDLN